jgi:hypothetical protein
MMPSTGATLCACGEPIEPQHQRHLTQAEYDTIPEGLRPIDGYATVAVYTCGDCAPPPFCGHPDDAPVPCPSCGAPDGAHCTKADGSLRVHPHPSRTAAQPPPPETCRHAHREDCDPRGCRCTGDDPPPARPTRLPAPADAPPDLSGLGFPPEMIPAAAAWLAANGVNPALVRGPKGGQFRLGLTQDNRAALLFEYASPGADGRPVTDGHGHEEIELRTVPIPEP